VTVAALGGLHKQEQWADIQTIVIVECCRYLWNKTTHKLQFYLSSLPLNAQVNGRAIRQHWSIENQEHWVLDVTFNEDRCRIRSLNSPRNLAAIRRMSLNAVYQETTLKRSLRQKRKRAAMNDEYMMLLLKFFCQDLLRCSYPGLWGKLENSLFCCGAIVFEGNAYARLISIPAVRPE